MNRPYEKAPISAVWAVSAVLATFVLGSGCDAAPEDSARDGVQREADVEIVEVGWNDIAELGEDELLVLDLEEPVVYQVESEVWVEAGERVMIVGEDRKMTLEEWTVKGDDFGESVDENEDLLFSGDASRFGLTDKERSVLGQEGSVTLEIYRVLCIHAVYGTGYGYSRHTETLY